MMAMGSMDRQRVSNTAQVALQPCVSQIVELCIAQYTAFASKVAVAAKVVSTKVVWKLNSFSPVHLRLRIVGLKIEMHIIS